MRASRRYLQEDSAEEIACRMVTFWCEKARATIAQLSLRVGEPKCAIAELRRPGDRFTIP